MSKIENNKLIAEFMGLTYKEEKDFFDDKIIKKVISKGHPDKTIHQDIDYHFQLTQLRYHGSWDWLIPVFQKIMDICLNYEDDYGDFYEIRDCIPDINQTYKAIVEFIKMYNEKQKSN
jgi:hypothetical protein